MTFSFTHIGFLNPSVFSCVFRSIKTQAKRILKIIKTFEESHLNSFFMNKISIK